MPILSVDVEDYFQTEAFSGAAPRESWDGYTPRVEPNTRRLLDIFDAFHTRATFFVLGWIADRMPGLIREIAERGHEVACHSYWHRTVYSLTPESFREDTREAIGAIENATGVGVRGYRAPTWSITRKSLWAIEVLAELGFGYDSSVYPVRHDLYGVPGAPSDAYLWKTVQGTLLEIPPATIRLGKTILPAAGGGYLRIFPLGYSRMAINQIEKRGQPSVVYLHPWEIDPQQPRLPGPLKSRLRQYWGLGSVENKLTRLLGAYRFFPFSDVCAELARNAPELALPAQRAVVMT